MAEQRDGGHGLVAVVAGFGRALRDEGLAVGSGDVLAYCRAMTALDPTDLVDLYWAGRACLLTRSEDIPAYDETFRAYFLAAGGPVEELLRLKADADPEAASAVDLVAPGGDGQEREAETRLGLVASGIDVLKRKSFADCSPEELETLRRIMRRFRLAPPRRRTRRTRPAAEGSRPDLRRTIRRSLRTHGEIVELHWRQRRVRRRPLVLILDISGSMADYSRALLQFAYSARRTCDKVEVFCFATRLTRVTEPLRRRSPDDALTEAGRLVVDWEGGTRIGDSLASFVRDWGRRGLCRGGVVVICSDGLDRGDPEVLAAAMERLSRLCHHIVWMNPHKGHDPDYQPRTVGMMAALPAIDVLLSGHDLASLEELAELLPRLG